MLERERENLNKKKNHEIPNEKNKFVQKNNELEREIKDLKKKFQEQKSLETKVRQQNNKLT